MSGTGGQGDSGAAKELGLGGGHPDPAGAPAVGYYESVHQGEHFQVKCITVSPGAKLSLQKHFHRAEHWIMVNGTRW